jgi:hypothetical protein
MPTGGGNVFLFGLHGLVHPFLPEAIGFDSWSRCDSAHSFNFFLKKFFILE